MGMKFITVSFSSPYMHGMALYYWRLHCLVSICSSLRDGHTQDWTTGNFYCRCI